MPNISTERAFLTAQCNITANHKGCGIGPQIAVEGVDKRTQESVPIKIAINHMVTLKDQTHTMPTANYQRLH